MIYRQVIVRLHCTDSMTTTVTTQGDQQEFFVYVSKMNGKF